MSLIRTSHGPTIVPVHAASAVAAAGSDRRVDVERVEVAA